MEEIYCDPRKDKSTEDMHAVDGYYRLSGEIVRQSQVYDVNTVPDALKRAKKDGLIHGVMVELLLENSQRLCLLEMKAN